MNEVDKKVVQVACLGRLWNRCYDAGVRDGKANVRTGRDA